LDEFSSFESHHFTSCEEEESKDEHSKMDSSKANESKIQGSKQSQSNRSQGKSLIDDRNSVSFIKQATKLHEFSKSLKAAQSFKVDSVKEIDSNDQPRKFSMRVTKIDLFGSQERARTKEIDAEEDR